MRETVQFTTQSSKVEGSLYLPPEPGRHPVVIFIHGSGPIDREFSGAYRPLFDRFLRSGFGCLSWDTPGVGQSRTLDGEKWRQQTMSERTAEVLAAIQHLIARDDVDAQRIGLWGISQAAWIIPRVCTLSTNVAFAVAVSCPPCSATEQGGYLLMKQMLFDGVEPERARELATAWTEATSYVDQGKTYETYEERYCPILDVPEIKRAGQGKMSRESYLAAQGHPMGWDDPKPLIARIRCPLLVIFGQLDSQVDPVAGAKDWEICLRNAKHPDFTVKTIASANHGIWKAKTGSYSELMSLLNDQRYVYPDEYMAIINEWLLNRFGTERRRYAGTNAGDGQ